MATVSNTLKLNDQMVGVLKSSIHAMQQTLKVMGEMDQASKSASFSKQFGLAKREISTATQALDAFNQELESVGNGTKEIKEPIKDASSGFSDWQKNLMAVNSAISIVQAGIGLIKSGVGIVGNLFSEFTEGNQAEIQLGVVLANRGALEKDYDNIISKAKAIQDSSMYSTDAMVAGAGEIATYLSDPRAIESAMDTLSMYAAGMSAGGEVDQQAMLDYATQLGKAFDGQMDGMAKKGFSLTDAQEKVLEQADDMQRVAVINDLIAESWDGLDRAVASTPLGVMAQFKNEWNDISSATGEAMAPGIVMLFQSLQEYLPVIRDLMISFGDATSVGLGFLSNTVLPMAINGLQWLRDNLEAVKATLMVVTIVVAALAVAWLLVNYPILLIIAAIGILMAVFSHFGISAEDVLGAVAGSITWVIGLFKNLGLWCANVGIGIADVFMALVHNLITAFQNAGLNIKSFFLNLTSTILGFIAKIAEALNKLPFVEFDYAGLSNKAAEYAQSAADAQASKGEYESIGDAWNKGMNTFDAFEKGWSSDAFKQGQGWADSIGGALGDFASGLGMDGLGSGDMSATDYSQFGGGGMDGGELDRVGSVGKIEDEVNISDEDIKMLRDVASMEYQLHYTQMTPQTTVQFGDVYQTADLEGMFDTILAEGESALSSRMVVVSE